MWQGVEKKRKKRNNLYLLQRALGAEVIIGMQNILETDMGKKKKTNAR